MELTKYKLGDIVTLLNGRAYLMPELQDAGKYRILRVGNLSGGNDSWYYSDMELDENKYCENGDLLYAWACNFGPHIWKEEKVIYHYHIWKLVENKEKVDRSYLYYYLLHQTPFYLGGVNGATMVHITKKNMEKKTVYIPSSLKVQHRIASILSTYDALIENNTKRIRLLEKMAESLYKEWFVRFRFPGHEKVEMENGLPKGWKRGTLSDVVEFQNGFAFKSDTFCNDGMYSIVTIKNVQAEGFDGSNTDKIAEIPQNMPGYCKLRQGDILISLTGNIGRVCRVQGYGYLLNQRVAKLRSSFPFYTYCLFKSDYIFQSLNVISYGTAQLNLSPIKASKIRVAIPSQKNIEYFEHNVSSMFNEIDNLQHQNSLLARQRDFLLPRLMSGKLEVKTEKTTEKNGYGRYAYNCSKREL